MLTDLLICLPGRNNNSAKLDAKNKKKVKKTTKHKNKEKTLEFMKYYSLKHWKGIRNEQN